MVVEPQWRGDVAWAATSEMRSEFGRSRSKRRRQVLIPATCVASASPSRLHSLDKVAKENFARASMSR